MVTNKQVKIEASKDKFYDLLNRVFVGEEIHGEGGFIRLLRIKNRYYNKVVKDHLVKDIDYELRDRPELVTFVYEHLYDFFSLYFTENGSVLFNNTSFHNNIYERVYENNEDVSLFWKTRMLHYIKTDKLYRDIEFEMNYHNFYFSCEHLRNGATNVEGKLTYEFVNYDKEKNIIKFNVKKQESGKNGQNGEHHEDNENGENGKNGQNGNEKLKETLKLIKKAGALNIVREENLIDAFSQFERTVESDFFINKDAKTFLQEQFNMWAYQYFWKNIKETWTTEKVEHLNILKEIAFKLISLISQFEEELLRIWNKPKFVLNSNYVITMDRLPDELKAKLKKSKGYAAQQKEWQELQISENNLNTMERSPIDTKYFKELELEILASQTDKKEHNTLDDALDGWLIKSENYQALNTILPKFAGKVQCVYIDPPFNTGSDFSYMDHFQDSTWLAMMHERIELGRELLCDTGSFYLHLDTNANYYGRILMNEIFGSGDDNFRNEIVWKKTNSPKSQSRALGNQSDNILFYSKTGKFIFNKIYRDLDEKAIKMYSQKDENGQFRTIEIVARGLQHYEGRKQFEFKGLTEAWLYKKETLEDWWDRGLIHISENGNYRQKQYLKDVIGQIVSDLFVDDEVNPIQGSAKEYTGYPTQKPNALLERVIKASSNEGDIVLDFFCGSGTTIRAAQNLGRKWIAVEMDDRGQKIIMERHKKLLANPDSVLNRNGNGNGNGNGNKNGHKNGDKGNKYMGGGFFKYYEMEEYEQVLDTAHYEDSDGPLVQSDEPVYDQYVFMKDQKLIKDSIEINKKANKFDVKLQNIYKNNPAIEIDIAETLSNLLGMKIKKINKDEVILIDDKGKEQKIDLNNLPLNTVKPLIWWEQ